jgi:hypothetical protein
MISAGGLLRGFISFDMDQSSRVLIVKKKYLYLTLMEYKILF